MRIWLLIKRICLKSKAGKINFCLNLHNKPTILTDSGFIIFIKESMRKYILLIAIFMPSAFGMQQEIDWLIRPTNLSTNHYRAFYSYLFKENLNKKLIKRMRDYERVRRFKQDLHKKSWIKYELDFEHEFRVGSYARAHDLLDEIRIASFILSGVKKNENRGFSGQNIHQTCWSDASPLHIAANQEKKIVLAALLLHNADTTAVSFNGKTPLQMIKRMALKEERFTDLEGYLKRYIWHKHVLLHKRFSQKCDEPYNSLPAEIVAQIAQHAYGSYT